MDLLEPLSCSYSSFKRLEKFSRFTIPSTSLFFVPSNIVSLTVHLHRGLRFRARASDGGHFIHTWHPGRCATSGNTERGIGSSSWLLPVFTPFLPVHLYSTQQR